MGAIRTVCDEMVMPSQPRPLLAMRKLALPLVGTAARKLAPTLAEELASAIGRDGPPLIISKGELTLKARV